MAALSDFLSQWIAPVMIAAVIWGQRRQSQDASRILTQQAVHETTLNHVQQRLERLERHAQEGR